LLKIINRYLDSCESESEHRDLGMFGGNSSADPKARLLTENLELLNELECPTLELIEVPKVKNHRCKQEGGGRGGHLMYPL
jgi:hypothetical protein